jgi:hypothetical protein
MTMAHTAKAYFKHGHGDGPVLLSTPGDVDRLIHALGGGVVGKLSSSHIRR